MLEGECCERVSSPNGERYVADADLPKSAMRGAQDAEHRDGQYGDGQKDARVASDGRIHA
ncbi:MAG TPA: hypothetical protein VFN76_11695 [Candidatus Limnocylindria bacterium]|nr:hypothetical protein [Candidatus Limnocylindria bacterium]